MRCIFTADFDQNHQTLFKNLVVTTISAENQFVNKNHITTVINSV